MNIEKLKNIADYKSRVSLSILAISVYHIIDIKVIFLNII